MDNNISEYVEKLNRNGVSTSEIIKNAGIGRTSFYEIMNGNQTPRIDTAIRICEALSVDIKNVFPQLERVIT